ncbi:MAG TPA: cellulose biosynthesis protein BcsG [Pseudidiomarina sp.]|nr:cellulose biosynthesis protein BcsG [Pseudidiomarina sp.]
MKQPNYYIRHREQVLNRAVFNWPGLGGWSFYFLVKVGLAYFDFVQVELLYNFTLIAVLVLPLRYPWLQVARQIIAIPIGISLLYYESYLPPFNRLIAQWEQISAFSWQYILELTGRIIQFEYIAVLIVSWIIYLYMARTLRMTMIAILGLFSLVWFSPAAQQDLQVVENLPTGAADAVPGARRPSSPDEFLTQFYEEQAEILFNATVQLTPDFDILVVNICSLSWDDLEVAGLDQHPVFNRSDIVLDNFNSATSYSGPAALRLLRAQCGHPPHDELFEPAPECLLPQRLAEHGFRSELLMNHSGEFDNFRQQLHQHGGLPAANDVPLGDAPVAMTGFDEQPIYADYPILSDWVSAQPNSQQPRLGFYNTTSLHDGNRVPGFAGNSLESFRLRAQQLLDDLLQLQADIRASNRNVLLIIVPEHGAALRGDKLQLPGLREIPSPALTHVPVLISLFGEAVNNQRLPPQRVIRTTGPSAVAAAIVGVLEQQPFQGGKYDPAAIADSLPVTAWVAENKDVKVMDYNDQYILKLNDQAWIRYPGANK